MRQGIALTASICLLLVFIVSLDAEPQAPPAQAEGVYVILYRAPSHITYSTPQVFHGFADNLITYLKSRDVNILEDPERGILQTDQLMSIESQLNLTKNAGAKYLFLATVERPVTKWIKVTVQAYELSGKLLWSEEVGVTGGMSGKEAPEKTLKSLQKKLDPRIDKPGLPKKPSPAPAVPAKEDAPKPPLAGG